MAKFGNQDLWDIWLQSMQKPMPSQFAPLKDYGNFANRPPAYGMTPEDAVKFLNAFSSFDLFKNPSSQAKGGFDYPTTAINYTPSIEEKMLSGKPESIIFAVTDALNKGYPIDNMTNLLTQRPDLSNEMKKYIAQGVLEHELYHANDPRSNPTQMWSTPNLGYTTRNGLTGGILQREFPAMRQEGSFEDYMKNNLFQQRLSNAMNNNLSSTVMPSWKYKQ